MTPTPGVTNYYGDNLLALNAIQLSICTLNYLKVLNYLKLHTINGYLNHTQDIKTYLITHNIQHDMISMTGASTNAGQPKIQSHLPPSVGL